jgi:hypothetical protein
MTSIKLLSCILVVHAGLAANANKPDLPLFFVPSNGDNSSTAGFVARDSRMFVRFSAGTVVIRANDASIGLTFPGAVSVVPEGVRQLPGKANFLNGGTNEWKTEVPIYDTIAYRKLYPGIDLLFESQHGFLKSEFVVAPGASPESIRLRYSESAKAMIAADGSLELSTSSGILREAAPDLYQQKNGTRTAIRGNYVVYADGAIGFSVGEYDSTQTLVIDPVLSYSTFLGGSGADAATSVAVDSTGAAYVTGFTDSTNFPTSNPFRNFNAGGNEIFVAKLSPGSTGLVYCTYIGGSGDDRAYGIAVDSTGSAYVTGSTTSQNFPVQLPLQSRLLGSKNAFVLKLNPAGNALMFSTYFGGNGSDIANGIALDRSNGLYIVGDTTSINLPSTGFQRGNRGGQDAFVAKLSADGARIVYSTYLGGGNTDHGASIAVNAAGNAYVTGSTFSTDFPNVNAFQSANAGGQDAFVSKLSTDGLSLLFSTYLGGTAGTLAYPESGQGIVVDAQDAAYIAGVTSSDNFPLLHPIQTSKRGGADAFVTKLSSTGSLVYSTFLGGSGIDVANAIAVDVLGGAYVAGYTYSIDLPVVTPSQSTSGGDADGFVAGLSATGDSLTFLTYLGGNGADSIASIAIDASSSLYVAGLTQSTNFPLLNPLQSTNGGTYGGFVAKLQQPLMGLTCNHASPFKQGDVGTYTIVVSIPPGSPTTGLVKVVDTVSSGLQLAGMAGTGWSCASNTCTRSDSLAAGGSYPPITVTVNIQVGAANPQINTVTVSGGGARPAGTRDTTAILPGIPTLVAPANGAAGVSLTPTLSWTAAVDATSYDVYLGTGATPSFVANTALTSYSPAALSAGATYSWKIVAKNDAGSVPSAQQSFVTLFLSSSNIAKGKVATQSSTYPGIPSASADKVVDGNTDGQFGDGSVSATNVDPAPWWQVDLGASATLSNIVIWNRTDCCAYRLADYWVFVSDTPFTASDTPTTLQSRTGTWSSHQTVAPSPSTSIPAAGVQGRYVRVQLANSDYLSIAEVQVFGNSGPPPPTYVLSGQITVSGTQAPLSGVSVALSGYSTATMATDASGNYSFSNLAAGGNYTVTPSATGYSFNPVSQSISSLGGNQTLNFTAMAIPANLAKGKLASQSSSYPGIPSASADKVVDGNTDGQFGDGSVSATNADPAPWWQVDLGASATLSNIVIWNRTDCCAYRLADYWVFVSDTPFTASDTPTTLQSRAGTWSSHQTVAPNPSTTISAARVQGRYVRVQLASSNILSIAEVQVFGVLGPPPPTYVISGQIIVAATSAPFSGVSVTLSGYGTTATTTDVSGNYSFSNVMGGGNYTITPAASGYSFSPASQSVSLLSGNQALNFNATAVPINLSRFKLSAQSSTYPGIPSASADKVVDDNTDGKFTDGSVSATDFDPAPWWQVDLGSSSTLNNIVIWNRTDCCAYRLADYWVFVSDTPFTASDTPTTLQSRAGTWSSHQTVAPNPSTSIPAAGVRGRYVRVQLASPNYLSLAEVQVIGVPH